MILSAAIIGAAVAVGGFGGLYVLATVAGCLVALGGLILTWRSRAAIRKWFGASAASGALAVAIDAIAAYEKRLGQQDQDIEKLNALVRAQGEQIALLKELVTGRAAIDELIVLMRAHDTWEREQVDGAEGVLQARAAAAVVLETAAARAAETLAAVARKGG